MIRRAHRHPYPSDKHRPLIQQGGTSAQSNEGTCILYQIIRLNMPFEDILVTVEEPLGVITLNRPTVLNALRSQLLDELSTALREMEHNDKVRAIVVTGSGEKA